MKSLSFRLLMVSLLCLGAFPAHAERFVTTLTLTTKKVQGTKIVTTRQTKAALIAFAGQIAADDPKNLEMVYDTNTDSISVVRKSNGSVVLPELTFNGGLTISNTIDTLRQRQTFVKFQGSSTVSGSATGKIVIVRNPDLSLKRFFWAGTVQLSQPASLFNPDQIVTGSFTTGKAFVPTQ